MTGLVCLAGAALALMMARPLVAHHSFAAEFDPTKPFKVTGTVTKIEWTNPHVWFYIDVADEKTKKADNWAMEMNSPNSLIRLGWSRNSMSIGDTVVVEGSQARDGTRTGNVRSVTLASSGKRLFAGTSQDAGR
jgi:hypothetical protein